MTGRERQAAVDMTRGSPVKLILRFTLPLLIGQMMQQIYTLTDTMITGHFIGDAAIAAIGASTSLNDLMINFANGMCNGCGIIIGQLYGAQKMDKLRRATAVMLMFGVGLGALLFLILAGAMLALTALRFGQKEDAGRILKITIPEDLDYDGLFDDLFERYTTAHTLEKVKTTNMGTLYELRYRITLRQEPVPKVFLDELRCRNGNLNITCCREESHESL